MTGKPTLPEPNRRVLALLVGAKSHSGNSWAREGYAFMVRWENAPSHHVVADGWARDPYEKALQSIDADYATVARWVYLEDVFPHMTVADQSADDEISYLRQFAQASVDRLTKKGDTDDA